MRYPAGSSHLPFDGVHGADERSAADTDERLDAPRLWRRPRTAGLLRMSAVTALLLLAAGVVVAGPSLGTTPGSRPVCAALPDTPPAGTVGFPLRLPEPAVAAVLHRGHRVDVLAPPKDGAPAVVVAADLLVLRAAVGSSAGGAVLYLAANPEQANALAGLHPDIPVSVTVRAL